MYLQELVYNTKNGGYLGEALENYRERQKKWTKITTINSNAAITANENVVKENVSIQDEMEMLKSLMITQNNINDIKLKLRSTRTLRRQMLSVPEVDLRETFPFFFVCPDLVIFLNTFH